MNPKSRNDHEYLILFTAFGMLALIALCGLFGAFGCAGDDDDGEALDDCEEDLCLGLYNACLMEGWLPYDGWDCKAYRSGETSHGGYTNYQDPYEYDPECACQCAEINLHCVDISKCFGMCIKQR